MNFTVKTTISAQQIDDIMCSALEGGISYWCVQVKVKGDYIDGGYASDQISRGGVLKLQDNDGKWHTLTKAKFLKGVSLHKNHDFDSYDAYDADSIVQLAIFGELIYG